MTAVSTPVLDAVVPGAAGSIAVRARGLHHGVRSAVVLVQGALLSGRTAYDIPDDAVPERDLALLQVVAGLGHAAVTFDVRGYGDSTAPADPLMISTADAAEDLLTVVEWTRAQTGLERVSVFGWSWGGRIATTFAAEHADLLERLVLHDPALGGNPATPDIVPTTPYKTLTVGDYRRRVEPEYTDPAVNEAVAQYAATVDRRAPNGVAREGALGPRQADPTLITRPTLMIYGYAAARAGYMNGAQSREEFFGQLGTDERVFAIVPDAGDYMQFQRGRFGLHRHLAAFLAPALTGDAA